MCRHLYLIRVSAARTYILANATQNVMSPYSEGFATQRIVDALCGRPLSVID